MTAAAATELTDADVLAVLNENSSETEISEWYAIAERLREFVVGHLKESRRICVVTSGGTSVPLERNPVRFVTNFSTGGRGSALAECLLKRGHVVIFLGKKGALRPFHRVLQTHPQPLEALADPAVLAAAAAFAENSSRLFQLDFESVTQYLYRVRGTCRIVGDEFAASPTAGSVPRPLLLLAAAVSDYFIPRPLMAQHKMSGAAADGTLSLTFHQVPKCLGVIRSVWAKEFALVSFKLETDVNVLQSKALGNLHKYNNDAVVANMLQSYKREATVFFATGADTHEAAPLAATADASLEQRLVEALLARFSK